MTTSRGRPRQYDHEAALGAAGRVFWLNGYGNTSLDDLAEAMGMNRPSIYRAFGNKEALYRAALVQFRERMQMGFEQSLGQQKNIRKELSAFYRGALEVYGSGEDQLGCMVVCTAPAVAASQIDVQTDLLAVITDLDKRLTNRLEVAIEMEGLRTAVDAKLLSRLIQAVLHSLAIRVRAGDSKTALKQMASAAVVSLLGEP